MVKNFTLVDPYDNELYVYLWEPQDVEAIGVVQILHGAGEHVGRYEHFAKFLNSLGFIVIGNDHLGHGRTSTNLKYVYFADSKGFYKLNDGVLTIRDYIGEYYPNLPVILFGHSMGSFLGRYTIMYHHKLYDQAIFTGTAVFNNLKLSLATQYAGLIKFLRGKKHISKFLTSMTNDAAYKSMKKNGLINSRIEWITADKAIQKEFLESEYCGMPFTVGAQHDLYKFIPQIQDTSKIKKCASSTAIFFINGELDALGGYGDDAKKLFNIYHNNGYTNVKYAVINNARHEVINEIGKENTYKMIGDFILKYL